MGNPVVDRPRRLLLLGLLAQGALGNTACGGSSTEMTGGDEAPSVRFPLRLKAGKRYLVDSADKPFLLHGDSAWSLIVQLTRNEVNQYLADRRDREFNTLLVNLIEHQFTDDPPRNAYREGPFLTPGDFATPNEKYFAHVDWVIRRAADHGMLVLLVPSYLGYDGGGQGWAQVMIANGAAKLREYGRFLGRRYSGFSNILWTHGGDYNPPNRALVNEVVAGIREFDTQALNSAHCSPETAAADYWGNETWLQVNNVYTYSSVYSAALAQYARTDAKPFFLIEARYENEADATEQRIRVQAYHALLSGAMGQVFGNNPIWHFSGPGLYPTRLTWQQALGGRGSQSVTHVRSLYAQRPWWTLVPDVGNAVLSGGVGGGMDRAVAALAADRSFVIAYMPTLRTLRINLGQLAGPRYSARWFDPAVGTFSSAAAPASASGTQTFRPTGKNATGWGDWVLLLESVS